MNKVVVALLVLSHSWIGCYSCMFRSSLRHTCPGGGPFCILFSVVNVVLYTCFLVALDISLT